MTWFDALAVGAIVLFSLVSLFRGVVAEVLSLISLVVAFWAAKMLAAPLSSALFSSLNPPNLGHVLAFLLIFLVVRVVQHVLNPLLTRLLAAIGLGGVNRLFGAVFGAAKGVLLVVMAVLLCAFTDLPRSKQWQEAVTAPFFERLALASVPYLPPFVAEKVRYPER